MLMGARGKKVRPTAKVQKNRNTEADCFRKTEKQDARRVKKGKQ